MTRPSLLRGAVSVLGALVLLGVPAASLAEEVAQAVDSLPQEPLRPTTVHPEARRAISELRSPYCPGLMLEVCPSPSAAELRDSIDDLARAGLSADSIVERVITTHGEEWRAVPLREGSGWWAWLMPPAVLLLGLGAVAVLLGRRRKVGHGAAASGEVNAEDDAKLRRAMKDLDESEHPEW